VGENTGDGELIMKKQTVVTVFEFTTDYVNDELGVVGKEISSYLGFTLHQLLCEVEYNIIYKSRGTLSLYMDKEGDTWLADHFPELKNIVEAKICDTVDGKCVIAVETWEEKPTDIVVEITQTRSTKMHFGNTTDEKFCLDYARSFANEKTWEPCSNDPEGSTIEDRYPSTWSVKIVKETK
jgi:hypothetical protein